MERRKAIKVAAAASLTLLAGAGGVALNSSLVAGSTDGDVGQLSPLSTPDVTATTQVPLTVYVDEPAVPAVGPVVTGLPTGDAPVVRSTDTAPVTTSTASGVHDDDEDDDHGEDDDRAEGEDREDDDRGEDDDGGEDEHEGAEDDD